MDHDGAPTVLDALRQYYFHLEAVILHASENPTDSNVHARIGDGLDEYAAMVEEQSLDTSHRGHPTVRQVIHTGRCGRPQILIEPAFLAWAYNRRSISALARFLGIGRTTLRNALISNGLFTPNTPHHLNAPATSTQSEVAPGPRAAEVVALAPIPESQSPATDDDDLLEPHIAIPTNLPEDLQELADSTSNVHSDTLYSIHHSSISDNDLDDLIVRLRFHYRRAGIRMLDGMLRRLGHRVQYERIRQALLRIDPVRRVFERIRIRRRTYSVAGPNALWHHDGQHGLIRWGIIIHGFIDGYSRLITGLQASGNNYGETVLQLFLSATSRYGVPSRLRGDHGTENILVAAFMEDRRGLYRGSYIWGRSVHNVRIERLWVDVTVQVGDAWANFFVVLEIHHGLDINNRNHIWLLHYLFLPYVNRDLQFFAESWNEHRIQIRNGPNRSPTDMFNFDMLVHGVRGDPLDSLMSNEELEVYGIDWEGLHDDYVLHSQSLNNSVEEDSTSWIGRAGPPPRLNEVRVTSPEVPVDLNDLGNLLLGYVGGEEALDEESRINLWVAALACARALDGHLF